MKLYNKVVKLKDGRFLLKFAANSGDAAVFGETAGMRGMKLLP